MVVKIESKSREERETLLRDSLQKMALEILADAGFTVASQHGSNIPHNKAVVVYKRSKAKGVEEINGGIEAEINSTNFGFPVMNFSYRIESEMDYFAQFPERHSFHASAGGTDTTEQQLRDAFGDYVSVVVLGHKKLFDQIHRRYGGY